MTLPSPSSAPAPALTTPPASRYRHQVPYGFRWAGCSITRRLQSSTARSSRSQRRVVSTSSPSRRCRSRIGRHSHLLRRSQSTARGINRCLRSRQGAQSTSKVSGPSWLFVACSSMGGTRTLRRSFAPGEYSFGCSPRTMTRTTCSSSEARPPRTRNWPSARARNSP